MKIAAVEEFFVAKEIFDVNSNEIQKESVKII